VTGFAPHRLFVDASILAERFAGPHPLTGIERVVLEYARWCVNAGGRLCIREGDQLVEFTPDRWPEGMIPGYSEGATSSLGSLLGPILRRFQRQGAQPVPEGSWVVNASTLWLERRGLWRWAEERGIHVVVFVHDLIPIELPEYFPENQVGHHAYLMTQALSHATAVVVNSGATEASLHRWAWSVGIQAPPVLVAPLGHRPLRIDEGTPLPKAVTRYFLILGDIKPRKNHLLLLNLWRQMSLRGQGPLPHLVIVGRRGWECEQVVDMLERSEAIRRWVVEINDADDGQVAWLLRGARALLLPSFSEGFGMPVHEALACGTPVICSPVPSVQEFALDIPDYGEPWDGARWLALIDDYARDDSPLRAQQVERMKSFRPMTWTDHFRRLERFLELQWK